MGDIKLPNLPDIHGESTAKDKQLRDFLIAVKITLDLLTGADAKSNTALIDLLNDNQ